jgi:outer membrane protein insertion porin family
MMKSPLFRIVLAWFVFVAPSLQAQVIQHENQVIEKIEVEVENLPSDSNFDRQAVLSRIKTQQGVMFCHADFDADLKTLAKEFDRVIPRLESIDGNLYITLRIWPKPTIRMLSFQGNTRIKTSRLLKELEISPGSVFDRQSFNKAFHKLKAYYVKKGFFEAELDYQVNLDAETNEVDIESTIVEGRSGRIKEIVFSGFSSHEESELVDMIITKEYNFFTSWFTNQGTYNEDAVQQDQFVVLNYLHNKGYADAKVEIRIEELKEADRIALIIDAEKGEKYTFGNISFEGNTLVDDEVINNLLTICPGEAYSPEKIREIVTKITNFYGRKGYIETTVNFEPKLEPESCSYSIHLVIEEGNRYSVGLIKVYGNCSTETKVILHEILLVPGEIFNIEKLQKTEEKLSNIGYFKNINVYAVKSEGPCGLGENYRDIHIEVEETNTGHFNTSFGFSSVESLFGSIGISEKNFNHKGLGCFWKDGLRTLRGGGEYLHLSATFGSKSRKYELAWTKPYFMDTQWTVGFDFDVTNTRYISHDYAINSQEITLHASYQTNAFLRTGWHYRLKNARIHIEESEDEKKKDLSGYHKLVEEAKHAGIVSAIGTTLYYDSSNHPIAPTEGFKSRLGAEVAGVGGYHSFLGLSYLNTYYRKMNRRGTLKFRLDYRFLIPYGDTTPRNLPIDERLFLGGDTTVRGYRSYRLGPQFGHKHDDPSGGISLQFYSLEYNHKIMKNFAAFIFLDGGHLSEKYLHFGRTSLAAGYGVRVKFIESLPEFTFGMGYPINPRSHSQVKRFFFQMGGRF